MISKPNGSFGANLAPILHQGSHYIQTDRTQLSLELHHQGVSPGASKVIFEPMVCLGQTVHQSCLKISTISKRTEMSFHLSLITKVYLRFVQNDFCANGKWGPNRAPYTDTNTISKNIDAVFHITHVT
jgi:hypothetical protein